MRAFVLALAVSFLAASLFTGPALAGPPYVTDDPQPTEQGRWEIYHFANGVHTDGDTSGEAGIDINYGGARDLQLTAVIPLGYDASDHGATGMGVVELAAKYKLLHQDGSGIDLAVFPRVFLPAPEARFGPRHVNLLLPVWMEKDFGPWAVFGGGGYTLNPGAGQRDFWTSGLTVTRQLSQKLQLGAEVYHQTREADDARDFTGMNLGMIYHMTEHWSLLASGGPGIQNARDQGRYDFYLALEATY
jgi:hypothetical protein